MTGKKVKLQTKATKDGKKLTLTTKTADGIPVEIILDPDIMEEGSDELEFFKMLQQAFPEINAINTSETSFEEQYQKGLIFLDDVPDLVEDWTQEELVNQYRFDSSELQYVHFSKAGR